MVPIPRSPIAHNESPARSSELAHEARTLATVQRHLLPLLFLMYMAILLVRANVGLAALQMNQELGFSATVFGLGAGIFIIGYSPFAVPSNLIIARIGARRWLAPILMVSGVLGSAMMLVRSPATFYGLRFCLGVAEAGFFPGVIYYLGQWMPAAHRARSTALFMAAIPVTGVVSGGLASALLGLQGRLGLAGWQWLFLVEGAPAVLLGVIVLFGLTDDPIRARWLQPEERAWLVEHLRRDGAAISRPQVQTLRVALADGTVWQLGLLALLVMTSAHAYGLWSPQLIKGMSHLNDAQVSLITSLIAVTSVLGMLITSAHSDGQRERYLHIAVPAFLVAIGWFLGARVSSGLVGVVALALVSLGVNSHYGPFWSQTGSLLAGRARAGGIALIGALGSLGGFVGPNLIGRIKDGTGDYRVAYLLLGLMAAGAGVLALRLKRAARPR